MKITWNPTGSEEKDLSKFFNLGFDWQDSRRLSLVYTRDAAISASIFSLGLICRDLCDESKNDKASHFTSLIDNARDYLNKCHSCKFQCQPEKVNCDRLEQAIPSYKKIGDSKVYKIESFDLINRTITVSAIKKPTKRNPIISKLESTIIENYSDKWHIHNKPSLIPSEKMPKLGSLYNELTQGKAVSTNLTHSFSQLSLVSSNNQLVRKLNELKVNIDGCEHILGEVLTLAKDRVCRINSITALNHQGIEFISSSTNVIYTCLYSAIKTIEKNRLRDSEKIIFIDPSESDNKIEELIAYISSNIDWLNLNDSNTQFVASKLGLSDNEVIVMDEN